jgi:hypothetical protein
MLNTSEIKESMVEYFMGHKVNVRDMSKNYNSIEDLDDLFFEENGLKIIEYIDELFEKVIAQYELLPVVHTHLEQVSLPKTESKKELLSGLKTLLENGNIDKRRYDDCVDFVKNMNTNVYVNYNHPRKIMGRGSRAAIVSSHRRISLRRLFEICLSGTWRGSSCSPSLFL